MNILVSAETLNGHRAVARILRAEVIVAQVTAACVARQVLIQICGGWVECRRLVLAEEKTVAIRDTEGTQVLVHGDLAVTVKVHDITHLHYRRETNVAL